MKLNVLTTENPNATVFITIEGRKWSLEDINSSTTVFSCISYAWGKGKAPNPFRPNSEASDRTIPAIRAVSRQMPDCKSIWVDAFCVPGVDMPHSRAVTLESMGHIYSRAKEVIIVLSDAAAPALRHLVSSNDPLTPVHLDELETEAWSSRAWTYQEAANSKSLVFTSEAESGCPIVDYTTLFSQLGYSLSRVDDATRKSRYPRLNDLEDLLADWAMATYHTRSAFQVMTIMENRSQERDHDHFYAMIGAITTEPASSLPGTSACEAFMALCEKKGDYSFVYSLSPREKTTGKRWRPVNTDDLPVIFARHNWGEAQSGHIECNGSLYFDNMIKLEKGKPDDLFKTFVREMLQEWKLTSLQDVLQQNGFKGSLDAIETEKGHFFAARHLELDKVTYVSASTDIRWNLGAPGLAQYLDDGETEYEYVPGVFIGDMGKAMETCSICVSE